MSMSDHSDEEELKEEENPIEFNLEELEQNIANVNFLIEKLKEDKGPIQYTASILPSDFDLEQYIRSKTK
jgi:DNA polymerase IIIc chi subunit